LMLALGWHQDWAAGALSAFVIPATLIFHSFWSIPNPVEAMRQQVLFLKNVAILGGLLTVAGEGEKP
jgi:putative oxidoreductase